MFLLSELRRRIRGGLPVLAQDAPAPVEPLPEELFQERIGVEVISIDVVVADRKGQSVEGLAREDFELRIDGSEVPIANFYAVTATQTPVPRSEAVESTGAAATPAGDPFHLIVYLDSFYLTPGSRQRFLDDLPAFLEQQVAAGARIRRS